jgi:SAM-dependent methyltransferase
MINIPFTTEHRLDLITLAIQKTNAVDYLEIGCDKNQIFNNIHVENKTGVDPARGGNIRITSDEFFRNNRQKFDVVFVDGLHYYDQVARDVENSLKYLKKNGIIIIHDMLPKKELHAEVPIPTPFRKPWLGDVWRLGFDLMARSDIVFKIVKIDSGCGILWRGKQLPKKLNAVNSWNFYEENYNELPLISFEDIKKELTNASVVA